MNSSKLARRWARPARDFLLGLGIYGAVAVSGLVHAGGSTEIFGSAAHARLFEQPPEFAVESAANAPSVSEIMTLAASSDMVTPVMLAVACATLFSLNMWFARHLRQLHRSQVRVAARRRS